MNMDRNLCDGDHGNQSRSHAEKMNDRSDFIFGRHTFGAGLVAHGYNG